MSSQNLWSTEIHASLLVSTIKEQVSCFSSEHSRKAQDNFCHHSGPKDCNMHYHTISSVLFKSKSKSFTVTNLTNKTVKYWWITSTYIILGLSFLIIYMLKLKYFKMGLENLWTTPLKITSNISLIQYLPRNQLFFEECILIAFFQFKDFSNRTLEIFKFFTAIKRIWSVTT